VAEVSSGFFQFIFGEETGYLCVATLNARNRGFQEAFFSYPDDVDSAVKHCERQMFVAEVYFCPTLLREPKRQKEYVDTSLVLWADADDCHPDNFNVRPTLIVESSPKRWQTYWRLDKAIHATDAESLNKRIAYAHAEQGADKSGWDLTQLLRVPGTNNHKRAQTEGIHKVRLTEAKPELKYPVETILQAYPAGEESAQAEQLPMPQGHLESAEDILERIKLSVNPRVWTLQTDVVEKGGRSQRLWQLMLLLFDAKLTAEEVFVVAWEAECNKFRIDNKGKDLFWKDVLRAKADYEGHGKAPATPVKIEDDYILIQNAPLLTQEERDWCRANPTLIEEYIEWAKGIGDAAWQYHQAGGFVILSTLLAGTVKLPTSFGTLLPNLWFMILADTTLTRKTTAMDMAIDLLVEVDPECVLATDGSIEGLMTSLSMRPGRPSIFLRDEFSGLLDALTKKDYMAGMLETLTKLYDGKFQKRVLRKETLEVRDPVLILFAGGIKERILSLLSFEHINSGFLPRFVFITAESDVTRLRPLGPPTQKTLGKRQELIAQLRKIWRHYNMTQADDPPENLPPGHFRLPKVWNAELTDEAWIRYNKIEAAMMETGLQSNVRDVMTPTFDRLCKSGLKAAVLLAAADRLEDKVVVTEQDLIRAFYYVEQWTMHTIEVIKNIGKTTQERTIEKVYGTIKRRPGILRSQLMQNFRLTAREADTILVTLEQRGLVNAERAGKGFKYSPL
jgi:hypothetical protein